MDGLGHIFHFFIITNYYSLFIVLSYIFVVTDINVIFLVTGGCSSSSTTNTIKKKRQFENVNTVIHKYRNLTFFYSK